MPRRFSGTGCARGVLSAFMCTEQWLSPVRSIETDWNSELAPPCGISKNSENLPRPFRRRLPLDSARLRHNWTSFSLGNTTDGRAGHSNPIKQTFVFSPLGTNFVDLRLARNSSTQISHSGDSEPLSASGGSGFWHLCRAARAIPRTSVPTDACRGIQPF